MVGGTVAFQIESLGSEQSMSKRARVSVDSVPSAALEFGTRGVLECRVYPGDQGSRAGMPFPESERVIYSNNPLAEVVCQLRFPPILRIDAQPPADFQDSIRDDYPLYREARPASQNVPGQPGTVIQLETGPACTEHRFSTTDDVWSVTLTRDFLSVWTTQYRKWEGFRDRLRKPVEALLTTYRPSYFTRVGLRYIDVVHRSRLGLGDKAWSELIQPQIAGEFSAQGVADRIERAARQVTIRLGDGPEWVVIRHGVLFAEPDKEQCFLIDCDFFAGGQTRTEDVNSILDRFNRTAGNLFRWCIQPGLHDALGPRRVDPV